MEGFEEAAKEFDYLTTLFLLLLSYHSEISNLAHLSKSMKRETSWTRKKLFSNDRLAFGVVSKNPVNLLGVVILLRF